tara:strand:- start:459 stop:719 length:261 start_codon:yes stop_codon:yes gene_type:complete
MPNELKLGLWKPIAISAISILMTGFPMYFLHNNKPTMTTVSKMIRQEAPLAIENELREIKLTQKSLEIQLARQSVQIEQILTEVRK